MGGTQLETAAVDHGNMSTADPANTETARADATHQPNLPALARTVDDVPPSPSLTNASTTAQKQRKTRGKSAAVFELASGSKAEQELAPASVHDQRSATLLTTPVPDLAHAPSLLMAQDSKRSTDPAQATPVLDPPALTPALTTTSQPIEPVPMPAPANEPLQLGTALESTGDEPKPAQNPAPHPVADSPRHDLPAAEHKLPEETAPNQTKPIQNPVPSPRLDLAPQSNTSTPKPKSIEEDQKRPEPSKSDMPKLIYSTPEPQARLGANDRWGKAAVPLRSHGPPVSHLDAAGSAALPFGGSTPRTAESAPQAQDVTAKSEMLTQPSTARPDSGSPIRDFKELATRIAEPEARTPSKPHSPRAEPSMPQNLASAGWLSIPNTGKLPVNGGEDIDLESGDADLGLGSGSTMARDMRAHAAKNISFELESSRPRTVPRGAHDQAQTGVRSTVSSGTQAELRVGSDSARVECVPHLVEHGENFWTISRLYYNSGRYHRALWKANSGRYPDINVLHVGDTIMIPPVEDLDQAYILPPGTRASSTLAGAKRRSGGRGNGNPQDNATESVEPSASPSSRRALTSIARTNQVSTSADGIPSRRLSPTDPELNLPVTDSASPGEHAPDRASWGADLAVNNDERNNYEPQTRTSARPRRSDTASPSRPVYKVRPHDTLRSIARDTLDDSRRANEILELNRGLIYDSTHLIVGQILELPEDARTTLHR